MITREEGVRMAQSLYLQKDKVLVVYPMGFGKTKLALDAVHARFEGRLFVRGLVVCHSEESRDTTWPAQIQQWQPTLDKHTERVCYASLHKFVGQTFDFVICDEAHYLTPAHIEFFRWNRVLSIILLTGTEHHDLNRRTMIHKLVEDNKVLIPLEDAIEGGVLPEFKINTWRVELTTEEYTDYLRLCARVDWAKKKFGSEHAVHQKMVGNRSDFLYTLPTKQKAAHYLLGLIRKKGKRRLIFCQRQSMCEALSPYRFHADTTDAHWQQFLAEEIDECAIIQKGATGGNVPNLPTGLVVSLNSTTTALQQRLGRLFRIQPGGEPAKLHILVAKDTMDEAWYHSAIQGLSRERINEIDLKREQYDQ